MLNTRSADTVIDHALSLGADFAELYVERNQVSDIDTLSGDVQAVQSGIDFGIGIRLIYGNKVLYGYTNKTEEDELQRIASELAARDLRDPASTRTAFDYRQATNRHPALRILSGDADIESKVEYLLAADRAAGQRVI